MTNKDRPPWLTREMPLLPQPKLSKINRDDAPRGLVDRCQQIDRDRVPRPPRRTRLGTRPLAICHCEVCPPPSTRLSIIQPRSASVKRQRPWSANPLPPAPVVPLPKGVVRGQQKNYIGQRPPCKPSETGKPLRGPLSRQLRTDPSRSRFGQAGSAGGGQGITRTGRKPIRLAG